MEPEIRRHMLENNGFTAKMRVEAYLEERRLDLPKNYVRQLIVEEGARIQVRSILTFLKIQYPKDLEKIIDGKVKILPLLYDIYSGKVFTIPETVEDSLDMVREEF